MIPKPALVAHPPPREISSANQPVRWPNQSRNDASGRVKKSLPVDSFRVLLTRIVPSVGRRLNLYLKCHITSGGGEVTNKPPQTTTADLASAQQPVTFENTAGLLHCFFLLSFLLFLSSGDASYLGTALSLHVSDAVFFLSVCGQLPVR